MAGPVPMPQMPFPFLVTNSGGFDLNQAIRDKALGQMGMLERAGLISQGFMPSRDISGNYQNPFAPAPRGLAKNMALNPTSFDAQGNYLGYGGNGGVANPNLVNGSATEQALRAQQQSEPDMEMLRRSMEFLLQQQEQGQEQGTAPTSQPSAPSQPVSQPQPDQYINDYSNTPVSSLFPVSQTPPPVAPTQGGDVFGNLAGVGNPFLGSLPQPQTPNATLAPPTKQPVGPSIDMGPLQVENRYEAPPSELSFRVQSNQPNTVFGEVGDFKESRDMPNPVRTQGVPEWALTNLGNTLLNWGDSISNWAVGTDPEKLQEQQRQQYIRQQTGQRQQPIIPFR